jgi:hypothetical protein
MGSDKVLDDGEPEPGSPQRAGATCSTTSAAMITSKVSPPGMSSIEFQTFAWIAADVTAAAA